MALKSLALENLGMLDDGRAGAIVNKMLDEAVKDVEDRGRDGAARVVTIKVEIKQTGEDRFTAHVEAGLKRPGFRTADHAAVMHKKLGGSKEPVLRFQEFGGDPQQSDVRDVDPETGEIR